MDRKKSISEFVRLWESCNTALYKADRYDSREWLDRAYDYICQLENTPHDLTQRETGGRRMKELRDPYNQIQNRL